MAKKDYYSILNIDPKATQKAIKTAYRLMALKYHPDHNPENAKAADRFKLIREAYDILSDSEKRQAYDSHYVPRSPKVAPQPKRSSKTTQKSKNLRYNVFLTLEEVLSGCKKDIRYIRKQNGESETIQLTVDIPKGAYHHQRLKVSKYGEDRGDLFVIVHIQTHPIFQVDGLDVSLNVPINYLQAAEGSVIEVPTLSGIRKIKLRSCEFENIRFTLNNMGLPDLKTGTRGQMHIFCFIEHPKRLNSQQKNALQNALSSWPQGDMMQQYHSYISQSKRS